MWTLILSMKPTDAEIEAKQIQKTKREIVGPVFVVFVFYYLCILYV